MSSQQRSPNFDKRAAQSEISLLLLHYTQMKDCKEVLERLCDPATKVSAHYVIDRDGTTYTLVAETDRAWHAGAGFWRGERDINSCSIGIELVNDGKEAYGAAQMDALIACVKNIVSRHPIKFALGHSDIAPNRKQDPGAHFDWHTLAQHGIGICVPAHRAPARADENFTDAAQALPQLRSIGYDPDCSPEILLTAFQRHWRPTKVDGKLDRATAHALDFIVNNL